MMNRKTRKQRGSHPTKGWGQTLRAAKQRGGSGCGCANKALGYIGRAGYRPTKKNMETLRRWRRGESIGFTATSSLKAKGLIPRTSKGFKGKKIVSAKYRG
jgi:hypothetical protein